METDFVRPTKSDGVSVHEYERLLRRMIALDPGCDEAIELCHQMDIAGAALTEGEVERIYGVYFRIRTG